MRASRPSEEHINEQIKLSNFKFTTDTKEFTQQVVVDNFTRIVATSDIPAGTLIYSSLPLISYVYSCEQDMRILCVLSKLNQQEYTNLCLSLMNHYPRDDKQVKQHVSFKFPNMLQCVNNTANIVELKITSNTFRARDDHMCVYNLASTFNHSCNPNCVDPIRDLDMEMRIYTIRDIKKGEECTIAYDLDAMAIPNVDDRREALMRSSKFICECDVCNEDADESYYKAFMNSAIGHSHLWNNWYNNINHCANCNSVGQLSRCSRCKSVNYCGTICQTKHWKIHKYMC